MERSEIASPSVPSPASRSSFFDLGSSSHGFRVRCQSRRLRLSLTFILLVTACVFVTIAVCSPHHRIRHHHGLHHHDHISNRSEVDPTPTTKTEDPTPNSNTFFNRPPAYLTLMYEALASQSKTIHRKKASGAGDNAHTEPIVRALLASQIADSALATKISFSLSKKSLGEFNRANIILALKDEVNLSDDGSVLTIVVSMKDFQVPHSFTIREGSKFYSFDVTKLLKSKMAARAAETMTNSEKEEAETLNLECTVTNSDAQQSGRTRRFSEIFDLDVEAPFILLRFQHIHLSSSVDVGIIQTNHQQEGVKNTEHWVIGNRRRKRSASESAPTTAAGIPEVTSQSEHTNGQCTCPRTSHNLRDTFPFLPADDDQSPTNPSYLSKLERGNGSRQGNDARHDDEYEVTDLNSLPPFNLTSPSESNQNNSKFANGIGGHNSVSGKHQTFGVAKLSLNERRPPPPHPSKVPPSPTVCKRHDWLVRPSDISLENVLRPEYLDLGFCSGTCPYPLQNDVYNYTLHSYFVDQHRFFNNFATPSNLPHSRCIPVTYKKLMVLTKERDGGFAVIVYEDASVDTCGCR